MKAKSDKWLTAYRGAHDWFFVRERAENLDGHTGDYEVHDSFSEARRAILAKARAEIKHHRNAIMKIRRIRASTFNEGEGKSASDLSSEQFDQTNQ